VATAAVSSQAPQLYSGPEGYIRTMHLSSAEEQIVRNCISRYAKPNTFCGLLKWLVFRINNAFKTLQKKQSEWEKAQHAIHLRALVTAAERRILDPFAQDERNKNIQHIVWRFTTDRACSLLHLCLKAQDMRTSAQDIASSLQTNDLPFCLDNELVPLINSVLAELSRMKARAAREFIRMI
jgi:hypothetical protein